MALREDDDIKIEKVHLQGFKIFFSRTIGSSLTNFEIIFGYLKKKVNLTQNKCIALIFFSFFFFCGGGGSYIRGWGCDDEMTSDQIKVN